MEDQVIVTNDIPGSLLQTDTKGTVRVRLYGVLAEIILNIEPEKYGDRVIIEQEKKSSTHY